MQLQNAVNTATCSTSTAWCHDLKSTPLIFIFTYSYSPCHDRQCGRRETAELAFWLFIRENREPDWLSLFLTIQIP